MMAVMGIQLCFCWMSSGSNCTTFLGVFRQSYRTLQLPAAPTLLFPTFIFALNFRSSPTSPFGYINEGKNCKWRSHNTSTASVFAAFHVPPGRENELVSDLSGIHSQRLQRMDKYGV